MDRCVPSFAAFARLLMKKNENHFCADVVPLRKSLPKACIPYLREVIAKKNSEYLYTTDNDVKVSRLVSTGGDGNSMYV